MVINVWRLILMFGLGHNSAQTAARRWLARMVTTVYKHNDLQGIRFGKLLVLSESGRGKDRHILWKCQCDCGNETVVSSHQLISGKTKSCGCYQREQTSRAKLKHGACGNHDNIDRLYKVWVSMRERCFTPSCKDYKDYGGRGISICQEWDDFQRSKHGLLKTAIHIQQSLGNAP